MWVTAASQRTWKAGFLAVLLSQGNGGSEMHSHSLKVTQLISGRAGNQIRGVLYYVVVLGSWGRALHCWTGL